MRYVRLDWWRTYHLSILGDHELQGYHVIIGGMRVNGNSLTILDSDLLYAHVFVIKWCSSFSVDEPFVQVKLVFPNRDLANRVFAADIVD
jgi:hypothetical protein